VIPVEFAYGLAAGLAIAAALYLLLLWRSRRMAVLDDPPDGAQWSAIGNGGAPSAPNDASPDPPSPFAGRPDPELPDGPASLSGPRISSDPRAVGPSLGNDVARARPRASAPNESLRLSQRVILHVYAQGDLPPGAVAPPGLCQAGIVEALGIPQAGLAAVLRRLEAAGILTTERGHVRGHDRRLKVYRLSARGLQVATELRGRSRVRLGR